MKVDNDPVKQAIIIIVLHNAYPLKSDLSDG